MIEQIYNIFLQHPSVSIDTRKIDEGALFFALRGAVVDGNDFALKAIEAGAAYAIVDREELRAESDRVICVDDVLTTLQNLATHHRRQLNVPIIAITGSNGKTTTKELLSAVLSRRYRTSSTVGNLNNHIGVPLTLLKMDATTEIGVVEMGANAVGEIAQLCEIAEPNYGIINNIGRAHLEGFGGEQGIRRGKGELYDYLQLTQGVAFVPQDDRLLFEMSCEREGLDRVEYPVSLSRGVAHQLVGDYNLKNIASAVAIATYFRVEREDILDAVAEYVPQNNRSQRHKTQYNTLILDCYNANPSSMEASIKNFLREDFLLPKLLILGDMFELGEWSAQEHCRVLRLALTIPEVKIMLVGGNFADAYASLALNSSQITLYPSRVELESELSARPLKGYAILVKGSRGVGLEGVVGVL